MHARTSGPWLCSVLALASPSFARQEAAAPQDPTLDNLVHAPGYATVALGSLGAVVEKGTGPIDMVLVSGFGLGASAFEGFQQRNAARYHMLAVTLPGFEGTPAPPMPPAGTSYGEETWTRAAAEGVASLVRERGLRRPVLVGHSLNGTQVAARVALDHPELARALVLLAGTPRFEPATATPYWPQGLTSDQKVTLVDGTLAPRWFKTVTRTTWVTNNFVGGDYSLDAARGKSFADRANEPPLPVLIRYLCEFHASDVGFELEHLEQPLLLLQPSFTAELRDDPKRSYLTSFFEAPWRERFADRPQVDVEFLDDAGILVQEDKAVEVDRSVARFLEKNALER